MPTDFKKEMQRVEAAGSRGKVGRRLERSLGVDILFERPLTWFGETRHVEINFPDVKWPLWMMINHPERQNRMTPWQKLERIVKEKVDAVSALKKNQ